MTTAQLVSVEEYLHTTFEHDAEYVEGRIVPRAMPGKDHSKLQTQLIVFFASRMAVTGLHVWVEQRIRTTASPTRYRIPDVCLTAGEPEEQFFTSPPFLCVEILSPDDSPRTLRQKIDEYLAFGVAFVWVIDPVTRNGEIHSPTSVELVTNVERVTNGIFTASPITVDIRNF